ncbi:hypothetical protein BBJ28_00021220 [Nothophytophthora sp. Chile5]|nr:hypothetical protein BBJ28_00021220 [Nothophytophthora sp. Chile5]
MMISPRLMEDAHKAKDRHLRLAVALLGAAVAQVPDKRAGCVLRRRLDWDVHKQTILLEGPFKRCYRMDMESFERLLLMIRPALLRDKVQSTHRTDADPIMPENMLQMTISRFTGYCLNSPGKVDGSIAFKKWKLSKETMELLHEFYIVGDNAYPLSDSLLVSFTKLELKNKAHSDYNFYLSQLLFKRPLVVDFVNVCEVIKTCMKLHNFCINERLKDKDASTGMHAVSVEYHALPESSYQPTDNTNEDIMLRPDVQGRILREVIVNHIQNLNVRRLRSRRNYASH